MQRDFKKFLSDVVKIELNDNLLANIVVRYFDNIKFDNPKSFFDSVFGYYRQHEKEGFPELISKDEVHVDEISGDYRLRTVRIANVRGIGESENNIPFGINLINDNGDVQSAIILGANGSGKSSLYGAVEYIYANQIGEALLRSNKEAINFQEYLTRFKSSWDSTFCEINTMSGKFNLKERIFSDENIIKLVNPNNHFISDYDIYENGKLSYLGDSYGENSFHNQVAISLGLQEFLIKAEEIRTLSNYRRATEGNNKSRLEKEQNQQKLNILKWQEELKSLTVKKNSIEGKVKQTDSSVVLSNQEILNRLQKVEIPQLKESDDFKKQIDLFTKEFNKYLSFEGMNDSRNEADFLNSSIKLFDHEHIPGNCPLCNNSNDTSEIIKSRVIKRIEKLNELGVISRSLDNNYQTLMSDLESLKNGLSESIQYFENELSETKGSVLLTPLVQKQESLLELFKKNNTNSTIKSLDVLLSSFLSSKAGYSALSEYFAKHQQFYIEELKILNNSLKIYSFERQSILNELKESIAKKPLSPVEELKQIEMEMLQRTKAISESNNKIVELSTEINQAIKEVKLRDNILNDAQVFQDKVINKIDDLVVGLVEPVKETIEEILTDYLSEEEDGATLHVSTGNGDNGERRTLRAEIIKTSNNEIVSPNKYFNTFRFRLFSMMVSCSIAIAARKNTKLNLPLVLDDIFFASDYVSRAGMKKFLRKLVQIFEEQTPKMPLQFILFTHDDSIFNYAYEALKEYDKIILNNQGEFESAKGHHVENTIVGRLYPFDEKSKSVSGIKGDEYWNLLSSMKIEKNTEIMNELLSSL